MVLSFENCLRNKSNVVLFSAQLGEHASINFSLIKIETGWGTSQQWVWTMKGLRHARCITNHCTTMLLPFKSFYRLHTTWNLCCYKSVHFTTKFLFMFHALVITYCCQYFAIKTLKAMVDRYRKNVESKCLKKRALLTVPTKIIHYYCLLEKPKRSKRGCSYKVQGEFVGVRYM